MIDFKNIDYKKLAFFRFKEFKNNILITNEVGEFLYLTKKEFNNFLHGKIKKESKLYKKLRQKHFLKKEINKKKLIEKYTIKKSFITQGPSLHIFVLTKRCDNKCVYCHASSCKSANSKLDMNEEVAKKSLDIAFKSPSEFLAIEFQGGEPLINWKTLKFIIEKAKKKNVKAKKKLEFRLVTNLNLMDDEKFEYLIQNQVIISPSFDGPEKLHNKNRPAIDNKNNNYKNVVKWIKKLNIDDGEKIKKENKYFYKMDSPITITKDSLFLSKEIIDEYISLNMDGIYLRSLNPYGFAKNIWKSIGYTTEEFVEFYKKTLDYIININLKGKFFKEEASIFFLKKILTKYDPNMIDLRSPCGAGIGNLAYNYNGKVYSCDEGRMLSEMGDESFCLGDVDDNYAKQIDNTVVKSICSASCLEGNPGCNDCVYLPYCGTCAVFNYVTQGNILGQMPTNERCKLNKSILNYLFEKIQDEKIKKVFLSWIAENQINYKKCI